MAQTKKKHQYIIDDNGKRVAVVLDLKTYERMIDDLDDYYCQRAYKEAKPITDAEISKGEFVTLKELKAEAASQKRKRAR